MAKQRKAWTFSPEKKPKSSLPATVKDEVDTKARGPIETVLKPKHILPPPEGSQSNYITDITTKWIGSTCYFVSLYACPCPNAISPTFDDKFARMEHVGDARFTLSFMRGKKGDATRIGKSFPIHPCCPWVATCFLFFGWPSGRKGSSCVCVVSHSY